MRTHAGRVRWPLFLLLLLAWAGTALPFFLTPPATLELVLVDEVFERDLGGTPVLVEDRIRSRAVGSSAAPGEPGRSVVVLERLPSGPQELAVAVEGYRPATLQLDLPPLAVTRRELSLEPTLGRAVIEPIDARSGEPLRRARVVEPAPEDAAATPRDGEGFVLLLPAGRHRVAVESPGHCPGEREIELRPGATERLRLPLSPELTAGEAGRVVLDWGPEPRDLDAHALLEATSTPIAKPHVFFAHRRVTGPGDAVLAELDVDHLHSEGLETITLHHGVEGTYRYFVHHYAGSGSLASSEAVVTVSTRGCKRREYRVPPTCTARAWEVVDLTVTATAVDVIERNQCTDQVTRWRRQRKG